MKKLNSYDELKDLVGSDTLKILLDDYSSLKSEYRNERIEKLLDGNFSHDTEVGIYKINNRDTLLLKPKNESTIFIPI